MATKTLNDYINTPRFDAAIDRYIGKLQTTLRNIDKTTIPRGSTRKRTVLHKLREYELLNVEHVMAQFDLIAQKQSTLPSEMRDAVKEIVFQALADIVKEDEANESKDNKANV